MRNHFDKQLETVNRQLATMGALCESAIANAAKAILERDPVACQKAEELRGEIFGLQREIERLCMQLLLLQQPVAKDLRLVSSALRMITDMGRIGDQSADIAEIAGLQTEPIPAGLGIFRDLASAVIYIVTDSVRSFVFTDVQSAKDVIAFDDKADELFACIRDCLVDTIRKGSGSPQQAMDLLMAAKYFERIGDHAVNIGRWVVYSITSQLP